MQTELLTTAQAAEFLGITVRGVQLAIQAGKLPATRIGARVLVVTRADLETYQANKKKPGRQRPARP